MVSFDSPSERFFDIAKNMEVLSSVYAEVNRYYVDEVDPNKMMKTGIDAMLESLDPYTNFIPEDDIEDFRFISTGQYGGIGSMIGNRDDKILILMPYKGFPAYKAGLKIGDEVLAIDGQDVTGKQTNDISKLLKGQADTKVSLTIRRYGKDEPLNIDLVREKITVKSVPYFGMVTDEIGYFKLNSFTQDATKDITEALHSLQEQGAKKYIFDLRGNTGGLLREAINISNLFIEKGKEVVSTRGKVAEANKSYYAMKNAMLPNAKLVILTNGRSASASEIVSGVMQDYDRGVLIGSQTFGKGLVQNTKPVAYNSQVKITTAKYYVPSGRCIQAIDYSNKDDDGSARKIPDSLLVAHRTVNSRRLVYDGAGITPDIEIEKKPMSDVVRGLLTSNLMFDYVTEYFYSHDSIADAKLFTFSEDDYEAFKTWLATKEFSFDIQIEASLDKFIKEVGKQDEVVVDDAIATIRAKIEKAKKSDLEMHKAEVIEALEEEIVSRYYYQAGIIESSFDDDLDMIEAVKVLSDEDRYNRILAAQ